MLPHAMSQYAAMRAKTDCIQTRQTQLWHSSFIHFSYIVVGAMTVFPQVCRWTVATWALIQHRRRSPPACVRSGRSGDLRLVAPPASSRRYCRRIVQRGRASFAVVAWARHLTPHPRTPLQALLGPCCRDVAALTIAVWRVNGEHRGSVWYPRISWRLATGEGMSHRCSLGSGTERRCPVPQ
jgi:hypothetical protein